MSPFLLAIQRQENNTGTKCTSIDDSIEAWCNGRTRLSNRSCRKPESAALP